MNVKSTHRASRPGKREDMQETARADASADDPRLIVNQLRRMWVTATVRRMIIFVGFPTALAAFYYEVMASNQYESAAILMIPQTEPATVARSEPLLAAGNGNGNAGRELLAMREYILSRSMFEALNKQLDLRKHYENSNWDWGSRLSAHRTLEQAYAYYLRKVQADYDSSSATLALHVRTFEPGMAQRMADAIVANTELKLNDIAERMHSSVLLNAELQLEQAKDRLIATKQQMARIRTTCSGVLADPNTRPQPSALRSGAAVGPVMTQTTTDLDERMEKAGLEVAFAEKAYESTILMLAELRARDIRQRPVLISIAKPSLPDQASYPRRVVSILTVFILSLLALGIGTLTVAAVREHAQS